MTATMLQPRHASRAGSSSVVRVFETELGWMALARNETGLQSLTFGHPTPESAVRDVTRSLGEHKVSHQLDPIARRLRDYAAGAVDDFLDVELAERRLSLFQAAVVERCRAIGYGETMSYGELAEAVDASGAARAVGNVMRTNPLPIIVPCHRVLAAGGALGGYSMGSGLPMKRRLLDLEAANR